MWVDNLCFFFKIESIFMTFDLCTFESVSEILLVVRKHIVGIRVSHESISAASHSCVRITGW